MDFFPNNTHNNNNTSPPLLLTRTRIHVVQTLQDAAAACASIASYNRIALDMEGAPLGRNTSLLQIAVSDHEVFIFDVLALGHGLFDGAHLQPILADASILKLCYDCRGDGSALMLQHAVPVRGLYDLQVVYTSLFQCNNDPFLKGLHRAVQRIAPPDVYRAFVRQKQAVKRRWQSQGVGPSVLKRPLLPQTIAYAAADVLPLLTMYHAWAPFVVERMVLATTCERLNRFIHHLDTNNNNNNTAAEPTTTTTTTTAAATTTTASSSSKMCRVDFPFVRRRHLYFVYRHV